MLSGTYVNSPVVKVPTLRHSVIVRALKGSSAFLETHEDFIKIQSGNIAVM